MKPINSGDERRPCKVCGKADSAWFIGRGNGPYCTPCATVTRDVQDKVRKAMLADRAEVIKEQGRAYWKARGITLGTEMECFTSGMFGLSRFTGIAKVGSSINGGAYVAGNANGKAMRFDPRGFTPIRASIA